MQWILTQQKKKEAEHIRKEKDKRKTEKHSHALENFVLSKMPYIL